VIENLLPDEILALTLYGESRGESLEGQVAVANVIMNRWKDNPIKYKTIREVCLEPYQFSCWNSSDPNFDKLTALAETLVAGKQIPSVLKQCLYIARGIMGSNFTDNTKGAKHYMTSGLLNSVNRPKWANRREGEIVIGNHTFFNV
jgi:N-acetylmuramoyl-L-alanine amidase